MLKTRSSQFIATVAIVAAMLTSGGAANAVSPASRVSTSPSMSSVSVSPQEATGDYYYVCQYPDGSSITLPSGTIGSCQGASYVQEYLDGRMLQSINITGDGTPATASIECTLLIASSVTAIVSVVGQAFTLVKMASAEALGFRPCD